jgi:hypothetical protein
MQVIMKRENHMRARLGTWIAVLSGLLFALSGGPALAQPSCADPFADAGTLQFSTGFWTQTDFCQHTVPYSEIRSGGVPPDGIPPIDAPVFETVEAAGAWLQPQSPVIALQIDGDARAYPLAILTWHEIVNDVVAGVPVAVTFCPLCNSAIAFDRRVPAAPAAPDDGETRVLRFGVSGNLRNSDLIMWDDATQSWWQQLTGEGIVGVYAGTQLDFIATQVVGYGDFAAQYPDGQVLARETGFTRSYGSNPYVGYDSSEQPFLFDGAIDPRLPATAHVLAGLVGQDADGAPVPIAYPFDVLAQQQVINDEVGGAAVVAFWQDGVTSALDARSIDDSRVVGTAALYSRDVNGEILTFALAEDGRIRDEQTGSTWNVFGRAESGPLAGTQLFRVIAGPHFWFAWAAFRPETQVYGAAP